MIADRRARNASNVEAVDEGFRFPWLGGEEVLRSGEIVEHVEG